MWNQSQTERILSILSDSLSQTMKVMRCLGWRILVIKQWMHVLFIINLITGHHITSIQWNIGYSIIDNSSETISIQCIEDSRVNKKFYPAPILRTMMD